jgi:uncharacterized protein (DUF2236 family)
MSVDRRELEARLSELRRAIADPRAGLFGPRSEVWAIQRESLVFLGAGRAALLQLAHPFVGQAIEEHSETTTAPHARFVRTFERVFAMVFGDLEEAFAAARKTWGVHRVVRGAIPTAVGAFAAGTPYEANAERALEWVHATLWDTSVRVHELVLGPIERARKERYYQETKRFAALFGLEPDALPRTWGDFQAYVDAMPDSEAITFGPAASRVAGWLLRPPTPALAPLWRAYGAITARLLPPRLRAQLGLPFGTAERALVAASLPLIRVAYRGLPDSVRTLPAYRAGMRRVAGEARVPALDRAYGHLERLAIDMVRRRPRSPA